MKNILPYLIILFSMNSLSAQNKVVQFNIEGNKRLKTSFIKKMVLLTENSALDSLLLEKDIQQLKRLPSITHASYNITDLDSNSVMVTYIIKESFTTIPLVNAYTSNNEEFAYRIGVYEYNMFGRNMLLGGFFQRDNFNSYGVDFRAPYLFTKKLGFAVNHQNLTLLEPAFFDITTIDYIYNNTSSELMGLYQLNINNRIEIGVNYFTEDYQYQSGKLTTDVPINFTINKLLYKGIYEFNNIDYNYQYLSGFRSVFNFQYVIPLSENFPTFLIGWNDFLYYKRIGKKGNWASRLRVGIATNNNSPFAPFSVDNNLNIRGVGNTIARGTGTAVLNTEFRYTILEKEWFTIQTNIFIDAGTFRNPEGSFTDFSDKENIRVFPGIGLRLMHKKIYNAIIRIDYGQGMTTNNARGLVFGIGQYF